MTQTERELLEALKLIAIQDQGCGGNVTKAEAWKSAQRIACAAIAKAEANEPVGKLCKLCGDKLMSDLTNTCYACNQKESAVSEPVNPLDNKTISALIEASGIELDDDNVLEDQTIYYVDASTLFGLVRNVEKLFQPRMAVATPPAAVPQWMPIESAPKDGTPVLLFARHVNAIASTRVVGSFVLEGWFAQAYIGQSTAPLVPTHWMPLPPAPIGEKQ